MTFPLGSLRSEGTGSGGLVPGPASFARTPAAPHHPAGWRAQLGLLIGGVLWLLAVLALATHNAADAAFSTSGVAPVTLNKAGALGAWFSDIAYFVFGYSVWWAVAVSLRVWLGALAGVLRSDAAAPVAAPGAPRPVWLFWVGLALLLAASAALEWTRLYQWEGRVAGGHAGGAVGYTLGHLSQQLLGFAGSGVLWIAVLVAGIAMALRFSWLRLAERIGAWAESLRERRAMRFERAEDARVGEQALREREVIVEVEHRLHEDHLPIVIEAAVVEVPRS
jgi:S-DNA-T family DNA segregation ATPase FtsK/SpoIIIE